MDMDDETNNHVEEVNIAEMQEVPLRKILENLRSYNINQDLKIFEKYIAALIEGGDNGVKFEGRNQAEYLNECLQWITNYVFNLSSDLSGEQIIFKKLLFLLSVKKLKNLQKENFESNDLRLSVINNGCNLIKLCINNNCSFNIEYYICQILKELDILENVLGEGNVSSRQIFLKRTQIILYNIEKMLNENKLDEVLTELQKQKENIFEFERYREYFIGLCYNVSLKFNTKENYNCSLTVLLLAYDVCKIAEYLSKNMKRVLQLLVSICLKYRPNENWQYARNALDLAKKNEIDMFYIIGKIKLAFISKQQNHLEEALNEATEWEHIKVNYVYEIVELLQLYKLSVRATEFLQRVRYKPFSNSDKFLLMKLELQIYVSEKDRRVYSLIENSIEMIKKNDIPVASVLSLCKLLLSHADIKFKEKMIKDSLTWYNYCFQLCEACCLNTPLLHHVQTRMCLCYLEMKEWNLAKQSFVNLKQSSYVKDSLYAYMALQIAFTCDDEKLAEDTLNMYDDGDNKTGDVLLSCCQRALLSDKTDVLFKILEAILLKYHLAEGTVLPAKLSQCLLGLCTKFPRDQDIQDKYLLYLDKALHALQMNPEHKETEELSQWFSRAAWNLALTLDIEPKYMFELFLRCCCFSEISSQNLNRLKNSLMLAAASGLHVARQMNAKDKSKHFEKEVLLGKIKTVIEKGKSLEMGSNINLLRLLYLYEFEVKCHANEWNEGIGHVKDVLNLPIMDVKTLEQIAAIVHEFSPHNYKIIVESLKAAVQKISETEDQKTSDTSKTYHSLLQVLFHIQEYISSSVEEENLMLCENLLKLIDNEAFDNYPQSEILWVMTKSWNWGIQKLTLNDSKRAHKWCTLAMAFMQKLEILKTLHEKKLNDMYSEYFSESRIEIKPSDTYMEP